MTNMIVEILGTQVSTLRNQQVLEKIEEVIKRNQQYWIVTPNPEIVLLADEDQEYQAIINEADLAIPDGIGLLAAAEFNHQVRQREEKPGFLTLLRIGFQVGLQTIFNHGSFTVIPEQVSGDVLMMQLAEKANERGWKIFLLGGREGVAEKAAGALEQQFSHLQVAYHSGPERMEHATEQEKAQIRSGINGFKPELLFVAFGAPRQERWIFEERSQLKASVMMGVGGSFDVVAKRLPATPGLIRKVGLRWLWRVMVEPRRLTRIIRAVVVFPLRVFSRAMHG